MSEPEVRKRPVAILIPYQIKDGNVIVFLQCRAKDATRLPDWFWFFGGGIDVGEMPEDTMKREVKEELGFVPTTYNFLGEFRKAWAYYFEASSDFESQINITEGQYGK